MFNFIAQFPYKIKALGFGPRLTNSKSGVAYFVWVCNIIKIQQIYNTRTMITIAHCLFPIALIINSLLSIIYPSLPNLEA